MKKLIALVVLSCASLWAQTLVLHNGNKGSNQEFKPGPAGLIIENIDGTTDQIGKDLIGGTTVGKCITTVANLSSVCGTTKGQVATVTDATSATDCTTGLSTNVALCVYNGTTWTGGGGGSGTVTNIATTSPITGGAITTTGTIACATCTTNAAALTNNAVVLGAGSQATQVSTGITTNGASELDLGVNATASGVLGLNGSTSGKLTITAPAVAGTISNAATLSNSLTVSGPQVTISASGNGNGVLALSGNTSGAATFTAPATAGTTTNAVVSTNNFTAPNLVAGTAADTVAGHMTSASGTNAGQIFFGSDAAVYILRNANNNLNINTTGSAGLTLNGNMTFGTGKGQHFNTQAANNDHAGVCTAASGTTCAIVFTSNYASTPACVITPTTTGVTSAIITTQANSGFTITYAPTGATTFNYVCVGNPN